MTIIKVLIISICFHWHVCCVLQSYNLDNVCFLCVLFQKHLSFADAVMSSSAESFLSFFLAFLSFHVVSVQAGRLTELQQLPCQILPLMETSPSSKRSPIHTGLSAARQWNNLIPQVTAEDPASVRTCKVKYDAWKKGLNVPDGQET